MNLGLDEFGLGRLEGQPDQVEACRAASRLEHRERLGERFGDLARHSGLERALAGEAECDLATHDGPGFVHSSNPEPHVSPAPIPVINTRSP